MGERVVPEQVALPDDSAGQLSVSSQLRSDTEEDRPYAGIPENIENPVSDARSRAIVERQRHCPARCCDPLQRSPLALQPALGVLGRDDSPEDIGYPALRNTTVW